MTRTLLSPLFVLYIEVVPTSTICIEYNSNAPPLTYFNKICVTLVINIRLVGIEEITIEIVISAQCRINCIA